MYKRLFSTFVKIDSASVLLLPMNHVFAGPNARADPVWAERFLGNSVSQLDPQVAAKLPPQSKDKTIRIVPPMLPEKSPTEDTDAAYVVMSGQECPDTSADARIDKLESVVGEGKILAKKAGWQAGPGVLVVPTAVGSSSFLTISAVLVEDTPATITPVTTTPAKQPTKKGAWINKSVDTADLCKIACNALKDCDYFHYSVIKNVGGAQVGCGFDSCPCSGKGRCSVFDVDGAGPDPECGVFSRTEVEH